ncbi:MAG: UDP-N-acetylmuramoyl-L-alanine--D-glutamate ligase [Bifidobacteriaceae bacterium]|jgi:UDP-N-acetylmuramoylalanine--D-glutamate ligase|nr:UDP-N-acetylmuramoyl-L-alanine--D-glutamate ligase [Bifidobacteriaceae bacterium]
MTNAAKKSQTLKYAIAGAGIEGQAAYKYFSKIGNTKLFDDSNNKYESLDKIPANCIVVRSPGIHPNRLLENANIKKSNITSSTNEFFSRVKNTIIGVTGTKGKGTVCSMIETILKDALPNDRNVFLVGNIGVSALEIIDKIRDGDIIIYELSSFQLLDLRYSPHIAVVLPIEPDHLDIHSDYSEYINAKSNIVRFQNENDFAVFNSANAESIKISKLTVGKKTAYNENTDFDIKLSIPGVHNIENAKAATLASTLALDEKTFLNGSFKTEQKSSFKNALLSFSGLDHRLKKIGTVNNVIYYDDSIATTPGSVEAAIKSFDAPKILLMGGRDKGGDYSTLIPVINEANVKAVILYGENAEKIYNAFQGKVNTKLEVSNSKSINEIVKLASTVANPGDIVILSPAASSFDMFENYKQRGDAFTNSVANLKPIKIGIFDSGRGGKFVGDELKKFRPNDSFKIINDSKNVPYGSKTPDEINRLTFKKVKELLDQDIIILACNTATAYAIDNLRAAYPKKRFIGFEPMFKPASELTQTNSICSLATPATLKSPRYKALKQKWCTDAKVYEPDCSTWASEIENSNFNMVHLENLKSECAKRNTDIVILACTHYIGIKKEIAEALGENVKVIEPSLAVNKRINSLILEG